MTNKLVIDGSFGEGGGQILRTSLSLSIITKMPFILKNIRAGRPKPGLAAQHLVALEAAAEISQAQVKEGYVGSTKIEFSPQTCREGSYKFVVPTAGCMPLVLQTVMPPLALTPKKSNISLHGGTHVSWSPCYDYLADVWGNTLEKIGFPLDFKIERAGYYPRGGGAFQVSISPMEEKNFENLFTASSSPKSISVYCILSDLPEHIVEREKETIEKFFRKKKVPFPLDFQTKFYPSNGRGNALFLKLDQGNICAGFSSLGEKRKSAEKVAQELCRKFFRFYSQEALVEEHLADQIMLPLVLRKKNCSYEVATVTQHLLTNAHTISLFLGDCVAIEGEEGKPGKVVIKTYS